MKLVIVKLPECENEIATADHVICPLLPEIGGKPEQVVGLVKFCEEIGAEEIFVENLNARGRSIVACEEALREAGHIEQADALHAIREGEGFARYVLHLVQTTQAAMREHSDIRKLRFLLYTKGLPEEVVTQIRQDPDGIVFLDDKQVDASDLKRIPETQSVMPWKGQSPITKLLALREMTVDFDLQCREKPDENQVREYATEMEHGVQFPPPVVFFDGSSYWLADGFHRFWAAQLAGLRQLEVQVYEGGPAQAIAYAAGANGQHGMRRTNADKRLAIRKLMVDAGLATRSDSVIAEMVGVDHKTVGKVRKELTASGEIPDYEERIGSDGRKVPVSPAPDKSLEVDEPDSLAIVTENGRKDAKATPGPRKVWPDYPEGFVEGWEATHLLLETIQGFQSVPSHMYASGHTCGESGELARQLRFLAAAIEVVAVERLEEVPMSERRLIMMRKLERFFDERNWAHSYELREPPVQQEDGQWVAAVVVNGDAQRYRYSEKLRQWTR